MMLWNVYDNKIKSVIRPAGRRAVTVHQSLVVTGAKSQSATFDNCRDVNRNFLILA